MSTQRTRKYGSRTGALEALENVNLSGKTIAITGTTSGIGIETARALALKGAHLIMFNRNLEASESQKQEFLKENPSLKVDIIKCDLTSLESVRTAAQEFLDKEFPLDCLILNAGVFGPSVKVTNDNLETHFAVNHLSQFLLLQKLLPVLRKCAPSRVVLVSSESHTHTGLKNAMPTDQKLEILCSKSSDGFFYKKYAYSKMCNVLIVFKLHREEQKNGISTYVLHPGVIVTDITRDFGILRKISYVLTWPFSKSLSQGAATTVYCAAHPEVAHVSGKYWDSCWDDEKRLDKGIARDEELQDALWEYSSTLVN